MRRQGTPPSQKEGRERLAMDLRQSESAVLVTLRRLPTSSSRVRRSGRSPLNLRFEINDQLLHVRLGDHAGIVRHEWKVACHHLLLRVQDRIPQIFVVGNDKCVVVQPDPPPKDSAKRRSVRRRVGIVTNAAPVPHEKLPPFILRSVLGFAIFRDGSSVSRGPR